jgi:hypothetical protein
MTLRLVPEMVDTADVLALVCKELPVINPEVVKAR